MRPIVDAIRQSGFRRWYERELLRGHGHLVLLLLSALGALGGVEAVADSHGVDRAAMVLCAALGAGIGGWALRQYIFHLTRAEAVAHQAACPSCKAYGRWAVEGDVHQDDSGPRMQVCCRGCGHRWAIRG